jgi:hypothetical protein
MDGEREPGGEGVHSELVWTGFLHRVVLTVVDGI